jgi:hypothetical protein
VGVKHLIAVLHTLRYSSVRKGKVADSERKEKAMTEGQEIGASHDEVEAFVGKLRSFHAELDESGQAMLGTILEGAQQGETGGYRRMAHRYDDAAESGTEQESSSGWNDLIGWIEEQGEEDTQGFVMRGK